MAEPLDIFDIIAGLRAAAGITPVTPGRRVALPSEHFALYADACAKGMSPVQGLEVVDSGIGLHEKAGTLMEIAEKWSHGGFAA